MNYENISDVNEYLWMDAMSKAWDEGYQAAVRDLSGFYRVTRTVNPYAANQGEG